MENQNDTIQKINYILSRKFHINCIELKDVLDGLKDTIDDNLSEDIFEKLKLINKRKYYCVELWYNKDIHTVKEAILGAAYFPIAYEDSIDFSLDKTGYQSQEVGYLCTESSKYGRPLAIQTFIGHAAFCDEVKDKYGELKLENGYTAYGRLYVMREDLREKWQFKGYKRYIVDLSEYVTKDDIKKMRQLPRKVTNMCNMSKLLKFMKERLTEVYPENKEEYTEYFRQHMDNCEECTGQAELNGQEIVDI